MLVQDYDIKRKPVTVRNTQANAFMERIHQATANMVRTFALKKNYLDKDNLWKEVLHATAFAMKLTYHTTLKKTPGQLEFERDMIFNIQHVANWELIFQ